jgi:hypothetical protein
VLGDAGASGATASFDATKQKTTTRMLTVAVQCAAKAVWPDGVRVHALGTQVFLPSFVHGHDVKRGASIELAMSSM